MQKGCGPAHHNYKLLVWAIRRIYEGEGEVQLRHTLREANQVADALAKHGLGLDVSCKIFDGVLAFISLAIVADNAHVVFPRGSSFRALAGKLTKKKEKKKCT